MKHKGMKTSMFVIITDIVINELACVASTRMLRTCENSVS